MDSAVNAFAFAKNANPSIAVPPSPSASATKMATRIRSEREKLGNNNNSNAAGELRGAVTPAAIRASMPPVRDIEFEYLKKFQNDLYRLIVQTKKQGCFHVGFTVDSRDLDDYTLDFIFNKLVAVLRHEKFFVALGSNLPRSFVVSWDPILTKESITQEEWDDPNSVASVRTRRFLRMQRKHEMVAEDEQETARQFQHYLNVMNENKSTFSKASPELDNFDYQPSAFNTREQQQQQQQQQYERQQQQQQHQLQIDSETKARSMLMTDLLNMARFEQPSIIRLSDYNDGQGGGSSYTAGGEELPVLPLLTRSRGNKGATAETIKMMQAADQAAGAQNDALLNTTAAAPAEEAPPDFDEQDDGANDDDDGTGTDDVEKEENTSDYENAADQTTD